MKSLINFLLLSLTVFFLFIGCASTKFDAVEKPGTLYYEYDNILIAFSLDNVKYKKQLETEIQKKLTAQNITSFKSIDLFSPLESFSEEEENQIIEMHNIELIIDIAVLSMDSNSGSSSSFMIPMGGMFFGSSSTETKLNVDFDIQMYDVVKKETIYRGTATCKDENDDISDCIENIFKSLASSLVSQYFTKPTDKK